MWWFPTLTTALWQGTEAGRVIENAVIPGAMLGSISSHCDIAAVFKVFDTVRRPGRQQVIDSNRRTGESVRKT